MVFSTPSDFYEVEVPEQLKSCYVPYINQLSNCTNAYLAEMKAINPETTINFIKKTCCAFYEMESCYIKTISPIAGCQEIAQRYFEKLEQEVHGTVLSLYESCKTYKNSSTCHTEN